MWCCLALLQYCLYDMKCMPSPGPVDFTLKTPPNVAVNRRADHTATHTCARSSSAARSAHSGRSNGRCSGSRLCTRRRGSMSSASSSRLPAHPRPTTISRERRESRCTLHAPLEQHHPSRPWRTGRPRALGSEAQGGLVGPQRAWRRSPSAAGSRHHAPCVRLGRRSPHPAWTARRCWESPTLLYVSGHLPIKPDGSMTTGAVGTGGCAQPPHTLPHTAQSRAASASSLLRQHTPTPAPQSEPGGGAGRSQGTRP